jgi:hypothetical protein
MTEGTPDIDKHVTAKQYPISGHEPQKGPTPTDRQSYHVFDYPDTPIDSDHGYMADMWNGCSTLMLHSKPVLL